MQCESVIASPWNPLLSKETPAYLCLPSWANSPIGSTGRLSCWACFPSWWTWGARHPGKLVSRSPWLSHWWTIWSWQASELQEWTLRRGQELWKNRISWHRRAFRDSLPWFGRYEKSLSLYWYSPVTKKCGTWEALSAALIWGKTYSSSLRMCR